MENSSSSIANGPRVGRPFVTSARPHAAPVLRYFAGCLLLFAGHAMAAGAGGARPKTVPVQTAPERAVPASEQAANTPASAANKAIGGPAGSPAPADGNTAAGLAKSQKIMAEWQARHPERHWEASPSHAATPPPMANSEQRQTYGNFTERDEALWEQSLAAVVARGNHIFHSGKELGTTVGISCDMCHPNAANTHPETYPKFQVQLGRVAMLRDMINWCLQNPVRGQPLADDDDKMKALEAYIIASRRGRELSPGKH